jgi:hypothetical protein
MEQHQIGGLAANTPANEETKIGGECAGQVKQSQIGGGSAGNAPAKWNNTKSVAARWGMRWPNGTTPNWWSGGECASETEQHQIGGLAVNTPAKRNNTSSSSSLVIIIVIIIAIFILVLIVIGVVFIIVVVVIVVVVVMDVVVVMVMVMVMVVVVVVVVVVVHVWGNLCGGNGVSVQPYAHLQLFNSLPAMAMGAHERPLFEKLLWGSVSSTIFVRC